MNRLFCCKNVCLQQNIFSNYIDKEVYKTAPSFLKRAFSYRWAMSFSVTVPEQFIIGLNAEHDILENFENVILLSCDLPERYRIWSSTMKYFLIHIDPDSGNTLTDIASHQIIFDQHPTYFFVFPVDIIRPFDGKIVSIAI